MTALLITTALILILSTAALAKGPKITTRTAETIVATWTCESQIGRPRTEARSPWKPHSSAYRRWQLNLWTLRKRSCLKALHARDNTIRRLQHGLAGTPMEGSAGPLEAAGRRYGISPYFIAAIAGTESSFGAAACSNNRYNAFGLSSCGPGWRVPYFRSWAEAYDFMARFLTGRTNITSGWPNARTTYDYHGYAANSETWGRKTAFWMRIKFGVGSTVAYP